MNPPELIVAVLVIVFGSRVVRDWMRHRHAAPPPGPSEDTRVLIDEVARLRDRVQVLERVVTDNHGSIDLDRRIEQLRDRKEEYRP